MAIDTRLTLACVQMDGGPDVDTNLRAAGALIRQAADAGARLIATPECTDRVLPPGALPSAQTWAQDAHPAVPTFAALARQTGAWLLAGSIAVALPGRGRFANRALLFAPDGRIAAAYDKIHLYDADLPTGERHRESRTYAPGDRAVVVATPWGGLGLAVCYDLRFPHLFRDLAKAGAAMLALPAAFTRPTGAAHWEVLLRARAIETGCFVLAPAQGGEHAGARRTWGRSLIIGPWGQVLAQGPDGGPAVITADIDLAEVAAARAALPTLRHDRFYARPGGLEPGACA
jgi:deaminated glutathione amidase